MFKSEKDLSALIKLKNVDIQTTVANIVKSDDGKGGNSYQVQAQVTLFQNVEGKSEIVKKVSAFALHKDLETAQDNALAKAQTLLGV